jgi:hypothetical protein
MSNPVWNFTLNGTVFLDDSKLVPPDCLSLDWSIIGSASQNIDLKYIIAHFEKVKDLPPGLQDNLEKLFQSFSDCVTKAIEWSIRYTKTFYDIS